MVVQFVLTRPRRRWGWSQNSKRNWLHYRTPRKKPCRDRIEVVHPWNVDQNNGNWRNMPIEELPKPSINTSSGSGSFWWLMIHPFRTGQGPPIDSKWPGICGYCSIEVSTTLYSSFPCEFPIMNTKNTHKLNLEEETTSPGISPLMKKKHLLRLEHILRYGQQFRCRWTTNNPCYVFSRKHHNFMDGMIRLILTKIQEVSFNKWKSWTTEARMVAKNSALYACML